MHHMFARKNTFNKNKQTITKNKVGRIMTIMHADACTKRGRKKKIIPKVEQRIVTSPQRSSCPTIKWEK